MTTTTNATHPTSQALYIHFQVGMHINKDSTKNDWHKVLVESYTKEKRDFYEKQAIILTLECHEDIDWETPPQYAFVAHQQPSETPCAIARYNIEVAPIVTKAS